MLNPLVRVGGGLRPPFLEQRAQASAFSRASRCLAEGYTQEPRQLEAQLTAAPLPGSVSGESSGDIEVINCEQERLSFDEAVTPPFAYCRAHIVCWLLEKQFGLFLVLIYSLTPGSPRPRIGEGPFLGAACSASPIPMGCWNPSGRWLQYLLGR